MNACIVRLPWDCSRRKISGVCCLRSKTFDGLIHNQIRSSGCTLLVFSPNILLAFVVLLVARNMSTTHRSNPRDNDMIHEIAAPHYDHSVTNTIDPEALSGIELTAACDSVTGQKLDDPYLVCFDEPYDVEKYARHRTSKRL
jgi:hypothetical protein